MVWSFGMNRSIPVINITDDSRKMIMYTCAHTGVVYDFEKNSQTLLQGHVCLQCTSRMLYNHKQFRYVSNLSLKLFQSNALTCTCASADKRWLATGDAGEDSMVIVWDVVTG